MVLPAPSIRLLAAVTLALLLGGCETRDESNELRVLREANASLRERLTAAEAELAAARAALAEHDSSTQPPTDAAPDAATEVAAPASATPPAPPPPDTGIEDTSYVVIAKHHVPGQLVARPTGADPSAVSRTPPIYQVTFRGEQSSRVYPPLQVAELAYPSFREGVSYSRAALNAAKVTSNTTAPATGGGQAALPPIDFDSIFGTR